MTLPRLYEMQEHWKDSPPVHVSVAAYLGIGKTKSGEKVIDTREELSDEAFAMMVAEMNRANGAG